MAHPFDRYAAFTDLDALKKFSGKPLRKSIRANTLKMSADDLRTHGESKGWKMDGVPWCREAFFIDREDRTDALGKDLLHIVGHFYMQEAASMLPAALLDAQPNETILDMSAAPGSKTTQLAARMGNTGVIVANDVQEKRLWTLKSALHRSGVTDAIVTKKVGQWFSKHMTERFDRVLCDAPCTAQGTARKDSDALNYCSLENIEKMARLQYQLLESAIHATNVGGRIVYSTCTLTPEENEGIVLSMLEKFPGRLEVVDPREMNIAPEGFWETAIADSVKVQRSMKRSSQSPILDCPFLRLWPQTYDTEGFFCAVLRKTARTRDPEKMIPVRFQEREWSRRQKEEAAAMLESRYGTSFMEPADRLFERGEQVILAHEQLSHFDLPMQNYAMGLPFGKRLKDGRLLIGHEIVTLRGTRATQATLEVDDARLEELFDAKDIPCPQNLSGHVLIMHRGTCIGLGLAKDGMLKNNLPRRIMLITS